MPARAGNYESQTGRSLDAKDLRFPDSQALKD